MWYERTVNRSGFQLARLSMLYRIRGVHVYMPFSMCVYVVVHVHVSVCACGEWSMERGQILREGRGGRWMGPVRKQDQRVAKITLLSLSLSSH